MHGYIFMIYISIYNFAVWFFVTRCSKENWIIRFIWLFPFVNIKLKWSIFPLGYSIVVNWQWWVCITYPHFTFTVPLTRSEAWHNAQWHQILIRQTSEWRPYSVYPPLEECSRTRHGKSGAALLIRDCSSCPVYLNSKKIIIVIGRGICWYTRKSNKLYTITSTYFAVVYSQLTRRS